MRICAATMIGPGRSPHDAWDSVRVLVDGIVDTIPGEIVDFSAARNELLAQCIHLEYDWALMLDTDERIHGWGGFPVSDGVDLYDLHRRLANTPHDMLMVRQADGTYEKPRLFRLPARGKYVGPTHEAFVLDDGSTSGTLPGLTFSELPKTPEQYRAKAERDKPILEAYVKDPDHSNDPRWWYYLGDTYAGLGMEMEALTAFQTCWDCHGWDEEAAWAMYRYAEICALKEWYGCAIGALTRGMQSHPGMAELPWLAGWCCYKLGRYQHALYWEQMAQALNDSHAEVKRIGFRYPHALTVGPLDVMRWSCRMLGHEKMADRLDQKIADLEKSTPRT